jgi:hypothetical protein
MLFLPLPIASEAIGFSDDSGFPKSVNRQEFAPWRPPVQPPFGQNRNIGEIGQHY